METPIKIIIISIITEINEGKKENNKINNTHLICKRNEYLFDLLFYIYNSARYSPYKKQAFEVLISIGVSTVDPAVIIA